MPVDVRLSLIVLSVRDLSRAVAFYRHCFDWPLLVDVPVYTEFELPSGQRLGLYQHEAFSRTTGQAVTLAAAGTTSSAELYFYATDPEPLMSRLLQAGAAPLSPLCRRPWGDEAAYFADLDGNVLVVATPGDATSAATP